MRRAVSGEWTKLRTVRSTAWSLIALVVATVTVSTLVMASTDAQDCAPAPAGCATDTTMVSLSGVYLGQVAAVVIAVLAVSTEYDAMMIRTTLAAQPRRGTVYAAKALVVTAMVIGASLLAVLGALLVGRTILPGNGFTSATPNPPPSLADAPTLRAAIGTVLYLVLVALLSLGIAAAVRHTAAAVTVAMAILYLPVLVTLIVPMSGDAQQRVQRFSPMSSGLAVQATIQRPGRIAIGPWAGLAVLAAYAGAGTGLGYLLLKARDV